MANSASQLRWISPWQRWRNWREARAIERRPIDEALWNATLAGLPFLAHLAEDDRGELRRLCSLFLDRKQFHGAGGLIVTDAMALTVAVQACLPVLRLGLGVYDSFVGIVLQPGEVVVHRSRADEAGIVHEYDEALVGEAMEGGPVMLSWADVSAAAEGAAWSYNVVIHEFAHVIDMAAGGADGTPPLRSAAAHEQWSETFDASYRRFCRRVERGAQTVIDPYGASGPEEFFAVAVEAFFVNAGPFRSENPGLYQLFAAYFGQDPAGALPA